MTNAGSTRVRLLAYAVALGCATCGDSTGAGTDDTVAMEVLRAIPTDTANAQHATPLSVRFTKGGRPVANAAVHFVTTGNFYVGDARNFTFSVSVPTDASGQAQTLILNGSLAGTARLAISVPLLNFADTLEFTILPGRPAGVIVEPDDTSAYLNTSVALRASVVDRGHNVRHADAATFQLSPLLEPAGVGRATTKAIGRARVIAQFGSLADTAWISIVPKARLIVAHFADSDAAPASGWYIVETDGRIVERIVSLTRADVAGTVSPDGNRFVYRYGGFNNGPFFDYRMDSKVLTELDARVSGGWPEFTRDGAWIVFDREVHFGTGGGFIFRVPAAGGDIAKLPTGSGEYDHDITPSSSPDGGRIVYASNRGSYPRNLLRIINLATGQIQRLNVEGLGPRWHPASETIAFTAHEVKVIQADGTGMRTITPAGSNYDTGLTWSPDGAWIVAARAGSSGGRRLHMLSPDGMHVLPLHHGGLTPQRPVWLRAGP